jgi:hypothetical protein
MKLLANSSPHLWPTQQKNMKKQRAWDEISAGWAEPHPLFWSMAGQRPVEQSAQEARLDDDLAREGAYA